MLKNKPYIQVNIISAGIIILIMMYFCIFSNNGISYPLPSMYNIPVVSTGLSRAFSEIIRLNIKQANEYNPFALKIFLFFVVQLLLRIIILIIVFRNRFSKIRILFADIFISILLFLFAFTDFICQQIKMII